MARPTFLQKVLRRPSKKYTDTSSTTKQNRPASQEHRGKNFHSTKEELLRIAADLNGEDRIDVPGHHQGKSAVFIKNEDIVTPIALDSTPCGRPNEEAQVPRREVELNISVDQLHISEEIFYTPDSSPVSSSPPASRSQTPIYSPYPTPPDSASSSRASLGSAHPQDTSASTTDLPQSSTGAIAMIPVINESRRHKRISNSRKLTYTDDDWAKDVRWLVPPPQRGTDGKHKSKAGRHNIAPSSVSTTASRSASSLSSTISSRSTMKPYPYDVPKAEHLSPHGRKHGHMKPKGTRAMVGMTVLLEVEEDDDSSESGFSGKPSAVNRSVSHKRSHSLSHVPTHILDPKKVARVSQPPPKLVRRRSSSFPSPLHTSTLSQSPSTSSHSRATNVTTTTSSFVSLSGFQPSHAASSSSHVTSLSTKSPYTSAPSNVLDVLSAHASSSRDVDALSSTATRGFTGLVLPRAAPVSGSMPKIPIRRHFKGGRGSTATEMLGAGLGLGDEIDLTRAGLAQTTMASVEVVRGIASGSVQRKESRSRRPLFGFGWLSKDNDKGKGKASQVDEESPLGFTAYRKPPVYVGGSEVLVQVWAVGLDGVDAQLVGLRPSLSKEPSPGTTSGFEEGRSTAKGKKRHVPVGYIPGRSFVGRVLEVGWEVDENIIKKGEWVIGLNSVLKCGALAEFILVDRHRIHRTPHPYMPDHPTLALASLSEDDEDGGGQRNSLVFPSVDEPKGLTVDELALLPLSGVSAYRAVRTLTHITCAFKLAQPDMTSRQPNKYSYDVDGDTDDVALIHHVRPSLAGKQLDAARPRVLILRGHDGPGALALQMLVRAGWSVWVHVPVPFDLPGPPQEPEGDFKNEEEELILRKRRAVLERIEKRLREWGADEVLFIPTESSFTPTLFSSSSSTSVQRGASFSPFTSQSRSSTPSPSASPSPFSLSLTSSPLSSPSLTPLDPTSHGDLSSMYHSLTNHYTFPAPYSYTGLPLTPYKTEATSVTALLAYLTRARVHFDAVIDTIGGREIWEAGRTLLSLPLHDSASCKIEGQFTTLVGDAPDRVMSTASDHFHAGVRALRMGKAKGTPQAEDLGSSQLDVSTARGKKHKKVKPRPVNYAWVNVVSDVDWEGADVQDSLGGILAMAVEQGVRPAVGLADFSNALENGKGKMKAMFGGGDGETSGKVVSFENTPQIFVPRGGLEYGGTVVSRIAG